MTSHGNLRSFDTTDIGLFMECIEADPDPVGICNGLLADTVVNDLLTTSSTCNDDNTGFDAVSLHDTPEEIVHEKGQCRPNGILYSRPWKDDKDMQRTPHFGDHTYGDSRCDAVSLHDSLEEIVHEKGQCRPNGILYSRPWKDDKDMQHTPHFGDHTYGDSRNNDDKHDHTYSVPWNVSDDVTSRKRPYVCKKCNDVFGTVKLLQAHLVMHMTIPICGYCGIGFQDKDDLAKHIIVHKGETMWKSILRNKKCSLLSKTLLPYNAREYVVCTQCGEQFKTVLELKKHFLGHGIEMPHKCDLCRKTFITKNALKTHVNTHIGKQFICPKCGKGYHRKISMIKHMNDHPDKLYTCQLCKKLFTSEVRYTNHLDKHKLLADGKICCDICNKSFKRMFKLQEHKQVHVDVKSFMCTTCGKCFQSRQHLKNHEYLHSESEHECEKCGKKFSVKRYLILHMRRHVGRSEDRREAIRHCLCYVCGKSYTHITTLNSHMRVHADVKKYVCDMCGKEFATNRQRRQHMLTDHDVGKKDAHQCKFCGKCFIALNRLTDHMRVHGGQERKYKCTFCQKGYFRPSRLQRHVVTTHHTG